MEERKELQREEEGREVVLEYVSPAREIVSYYIAPPKAEERAAVPPPRRRRGKRIFLASVALIAALVGLFVYLTQSGILNIYYGYGDGYYDGRYGGYYYYDGPAAFPEEEGEGVPQMPLGGHDADRRLLISEEQGEQLSAREIYERVNPSAVTVVAVLDDDRAGIGSGIIMSSDGYILTNAHVVSDAEDCFVVLDTGAQYDVQLVGYDMEQDIAVLKAMGAEDLPAAVFGDSDALRVGDPVYAIGNPLGVELRGTLTDGIVSAINRDVTLDGENMTLIQTNAALNSGNSGGPLINIYGQVVGINLMKMDRQGRPIASVEGLGFAIPIASAAYMVDDILAYGEVRGEPVMGISVLNAEDVEKNGTAGIEVYTVDKGGSAERAGLRVGDIIVAADGEEVHSSDDLLRIRRRYRAGEELPLSILRGGERMEFSVLLEHAKTQEK